MNFKRTLLAFASLTLGFVVVGCATVSNDTAHTSTAPKSLVIEVPNPPPPPKEEAKPTTPEPGHIWVAGYWDYIDGHHLWRDGRWVQGKPGYEYVRAHYEFDGKAWQFHVPHWHRRSPAESPTMAATR
jgi:hypothetical protein